MARTVTCTNNNGYTVSFEENAFSPFLLAHIDGVYGFQNDVTISGNRMTDGGTYLGTVAKVRDITLTVMDRPDVIFSNGQHSRDILYRLFEKGTLGTMLYTENGDTRVINYRVEKMTVGSAKKRLYMISLVCEDPYFYAKNTESINLSTVVGAFEFPHEFVDYGEEISYISPERIATIVNDNAVGGIGMTVTITMRGEVVNPVISHIENIEDFQLGSSAKPLTLVAGDKLIITTEVNNKHVYLIHEGVQTEINEYMTEDSVFIQLNKGVNHIGYNAETGSGNMTVNIKYRFKYQGV